MILNIGKFLDHKMIPGTLNAKSGHTILTHHAPLQRSMIQRDLVCVVSLRQVNQAVFRKLKAKLRAAAPPLPPLLIRNM